MKKIMVIVFVLFMICSASSAFAYRRGSSPSTSGDYTQEVERARHQMRRQVSL